MTDEQMIQLAINTIRTLSIDAVQQAKSGHPGTPMNRATTSTIEAFKADELEGENCCRTLLTSYECSKPSTTRTLSG